MAVVGSVTAECSSEARFITLPRDSVRLRTRMTLNQDVVTFDKCAPLMEQRLDLPQQAPQLQW